MKKTLYLLLTLFLISCSNNSSNTDIFSNRDINFKKLSLGKNTSYKDKHYISNIKAELIPLYNSIKLSDEEKDYVIENTCYAKDLYYINSMFLNEREKTACFVGYIPEDKNSLNNLIDYIYSMEQENNILKNYFYINGNKNIQYRVQLKDTILFFVIFEAKNSNYLVLNYTFPLYNEYASMDNIANSINSIEFY